MVHSFSRKVVCVSLASAAAVTWTSIAAADTPGRDTALAPEAGPPPTLADGFVGDLEGRVQRLLPSLAGELDKLHLKGRGVEYRQPLDWEGRALELRVRGGGFKGKGRGKGRDRSRAYGLRLELRF